MSYEYMFFDAGLCERFTQFATARGIPCQVRPDPIMGFVATLPDDLADDVEAEIETEYDALMEIQREMVDAEDDAARCLMGVEVTLPDGQICQVRLPAAYARRLCEHFSPQEIHEIVAAIAADLSRPAGPLCRSN